MRIPRHPARKPRRGRRDTQKPKVVDWPKSKTNNICEVVTAGRGLMVDEHTGRQVAVEGLRPTTIEMDGHGDGGMGWPGMAFHFRATCAAARTFQQSPCSAVSNRQRRQTMHTRLDKSEPHAEHPEDAGTLTCIP